MLKALRISGQNAKIVRSIERTLFPNRGNDSTRHLESIEILPCNLPFNRLIYAFKTAALEVNKHSPLDTGYQQRKKQTYAYTYPRHAGIIVLRLSPFAISIAA